MLGHAFLFGIMILSGVAAARQAGDTFEPLFGRVNLALQGVASGLPGFKLPVR